MKSNSLSFRTRSPVKQRLILDQLRHAIVSGKLPAGSQLPTRPELEAEFQVSSNTLQRAMDRLTAEGFIYGKGTIGTFVSSSPPFVSNYGIVFPYVNSEKNRWNRFWVALKNEAERFGQAAGAQQKVSIYYSDNARSDSEEYQRLLRHIRDHRVAGLVILGPVAMYERSPVIETPGLPVVALGGLGELVPTLQFAPFADRALDYLASRGRRKVAFVTSAGELASPQCASNWINLVQARGMMTDDRWIHGADIRNPVVVQNLVHLLMSSSQPDRPDGIVIGDDNLVEYAAAGLVKAGIQVPVEADVVAHCNFPWPTPSVLPMKRLGYDVRECLQIFMKMINHRRSGEPFNPSPLPARMEDEISYLP